MFYPFNTTILTPNTIPSNGLKLPDKNPKGAGYNLVIYLHEEDSFYKSCISLLVLLNFKFSSTDRHTILLTSG